MLRLDAKSYYQTYSHYMGMHMHMYLSVFTTVLYKPKSYLLHAFGAGPEFIHLWSKDRSVAGDRRAMARD